MRSFPLQIVTADGLHFDGEAEKLLVRTITGDVCILAKHCDYVTALGMGEAQLTTCLLYTSRADRLQNVLGVVIHIRIQSLFKVTDIRYFNGFEIIVDNGIQNAYLTRHFHRRVAPTKC